MKRFSIADTICRAFKSYRMLVDLHARLAENHENLSIAYEDTVRQRDLLGLQCDSLEAQKKELVAARGFLEAQRNHLEGQKSQLLDKTQSLSDINAALLNERQALLVEREEANLIKDEIVSKNASLASQKLRLLNEKDSLKDQVGSLLCQKKQLVAQAQILSEKMESIFLKPGHFYSPIPDFDEVLADAEKYFGVTPKSIPGIDLNENEQIVLLKQMSCWWRDFPYANKGTVKYLYSPENNAYSYTDALALFGFIRHFRPKKLIEVGSGYSSAVIVDTLERFLDYSLDCRFVEPYPEVLKNIFKERFFELIHIQKKLQDLDVAFFGALDAQDILFIDSTHVCKIGSDVDHLFKSILPSLNSGVIVHIHDIFFPFEYPKQWVEEGRAWNEAYILRSFLQFNSQFKILFWPSWILKNQRKAWNESMKEMHSDFSWMASGTSSIWLQKL